MYFKLYAGVLEDLLIYKIHSINVDNITTDFTQAGWVGDTKSCIKISKTHDDIVIGLDNYNKLTSRMLDSLQVSIFIGLYNNPTDGQVRTLRLNALKIAEERRKIMDRIKRAVNKINKSNTAFQEIFIIRGGN